MSAQAQLLDFLEQLGLRSATLFAVAGHALQIGSEPAEVGENALEIGDGHDSAQCE